MVNTAAPVQNLHIMQLSRFSTSQSSAEKLIITLSVQFTFKEHNEVKDLISLIQNEKNICELVFDLSATEHIDSSGIGGFIWIYRVYHEHIDVFKLTHVKPCIMRVLRMLNLEKLYQLHPLNSAKQ